MGEGSLSGPCRSEKHRCIKRERQRQYTKRQRDTERQQTKRDRGRHRETKRLHIKYCLSSCRSEKHRCIERETAKTYEETEGHRETIYIKRDRGRQRETERDIERQRDCILREKREQYTHRSIVGEVDLRLRHGERGLCQVEALAPAVHWALLPKKK